MFLWEYRNGQSRWTIERSPNNGGSQNARLDAKKKIYIYTYGQKYWAKKTAYAHNTCAQDFFFIFFILGVVFRWTPFIAPRDWTFYVLGKSELPSLFLVYGQYMC